MRNLQTRIGSRLIRSLLQASTNVVSTFSKNNREDGFCALYNRWRNSCLFFAYIRVVYRRNLKVASTMFRSLRIAASIQRPNIIPGSMRERQCGTQPTCNRQEIKSTQLFLCFRFVSLPICCNFSCTLELQPIQTCTPGWPDCGPVTANASSKGNELRSSARCPFVLFAQLTLILTKGGVMRKSSCG